MPTASSAQVAAMTAYMIARRLMIPPPWLPEGCPTSRRGRRLLARRGRRGRGVAAGRGRRGRRVAAGRGRRGRRVAAGRGRRGRRVAGGLPGGCPAGRRLAGGAVVVGTSAATTPATASAGRGRREGLVAALDHRPRTHLGHQLVVIGGVGIEVAQLRGERLVGIAGDRLGRGL